jgi:hypothetical protein
MDDITISIQNNSFTSKVRFGQDIPEYLIGKKKFKESQIFFFFFFFPKIVIFLLFFPFVAVPGYSSTGQAVKIEFRNSFFKLTNVLQGIQFAAEYASTKLPLIECK